MTHPCIGHIREYPSPPEIRRSRSRETLHNVSTFSLGESLRVPMSMSGLQGTPWDWHQVSCWAAVVPRSMFLPDFMSSLASGFVTVDLKSNTSLSIGRRWDSTSTSLQTLLSRDVRRFRMPSCLCAEKPPFLHDREWLNVNRSAHAQWLGKSVRGRW